MKFFNNAIYLFLICMALHMNILVSEEEYWWRTVLERRNRQYMYRRGHYVRYFKQHKSHKPYIRLGVNRAVAECRRLFKYSRWNCTSKNIEKPFGYIVDVACRETAFVYAITSAGLAYEMIRACTKGHVVGCNDSCLEPNGFDINKMRLYNETYAINRQCHDKIKYGIKVWENFVFKGEKASDTRANFNIKNSRLGLQEVYKSSKLSCRCHGVTGSCTLQVCTEKVTNYFGEIGVSLYKKYEAAQFTPLDQVAVENDTKKLNNFQNTYSKNYGPDFNYNSVYERRQPVVRRRRDHLGNQFEEVKKMEFYDYSPDYCKKSAYSYGVKNRLCIPSLTPEKYEEGLRSCNEICCYGRGTRKVLKTFYTNCVFKYCCNVVCDERKKIVVEYYCL